MGISGASRGAGYILAIRSAPERVVLHAVHDPIEQNRQRFAAEYGIQNQFDRFETLVEQCDIVIVASPQQYHAPQAAYALRNGRHVLSEVPAVVSQEQASDLLAAARESGSVYMLSENYCYTRENLIVGGMARAGLFGELYYGESEYVHEMKSYHTDSAGDPTWRFHWQVGRNAHTYPTHSLGPLLEWFNDRIESVSCVGSGRHTDPEHVMDDTVVMTARTRHGALLTTRLDLLSNRPGLLDFYSLQGTGGAYESARAQGQAPRVYLEGKTQHDEWEPLDAFAADFLPPRYAKPPEGAGHWGADAWPFLDFLRSIETGSTPPIDVYRALEMSLPTVASEQSMAQGGSWIHVPDPRTMTAGIGINPGRNSPLD